MKKDDKTEAESTIESNDKARRKLLKSVAAGGAAISAGSQVPVGKWTTPVVDSIIVPAHAETTGSGGDPGGGTTVAPPTTGASPTPRPTTTPRATTTPCPLACTGPQVIERFFPGINPDCREGDWIVGWSAKVLTAQLCEPIAGVPVSLAVEVTGSTNATNIGTPFLVGTASPQLTNPSGIATFSEVSLNFTNNTGNNASVDLKVTLSAMGQQCPINFTFTEHPVPVCSVDD